MAPARRPPMPPRRSLLLLLAVASGAWVGGRQGTPASPRTQAERTGFVETSTYASVVAFVDSLGRLGRPIATGSIGRTVEGREIPWVVASRPLFGTPQVARRSGRPIVYVQANIHAGEVEGKEVMQAMLRDLLLDPHPNVLDSLVLIVVPIYNADGNETFGPQERNRGSQNGPALVGVRANAQGYDLNRDYMKADAPETRASLAMFTAWDPHVFIDLHTTDGSFHGYNLTYAPSLNPAAELPGATFGGAWAHDSLLPEVRRRVRARHGIESFDFGDYPGRDSVPSRWNTFDHRPRFGTNYYALRGRISLLSEAFSHDSFALRARATDAFVREVLSLVAERRTTVLELARRSDAALRAGTIPPVPVRAVETRTPRTADVRYEVVERTGDTVRYEAGLPRGVRRTGVYRTAPMAIYDRFDATVTRPAPWGYAIAPDDTSAVNLLRAHGIVLERLTSAWSGDAGTQFRVDSAAVAERPFQQHREVRLAGQWVDGQRVELAAGTWIVRPAQPLGVLVMYLLEPESDDGIVDWDVGGRRAGGNGTAPVVRLARPVPTRPAPGP